MRPTRPTDADADRIAPEVRLQEEQHVSPTQRITIFETRFRDGAQAGAR